MALRIKVSARAALQINRAAEWWAENRPAAPGAVRTDIGEAMALLARQPGIGTSYEGTRVRGVRRLLVGRIQYFIYYRATSDTLELLAVWHTSRGKQPSL
ncbi:MAG: type II toxin-antitoxin system RelE/ParE family toxin [Sulfuritalea sp.]|nr:type II toxin-antitoxin system RelE/ParE family toxin [Sulfuritalea sp.]MBK8121673.1 type II toxin-antitoxin system RelE/ParE family toxin [Sulfuritalea sp.]